ncbi:reverse transcriptase domain-containing protein [Tanacetum coccineum]
MIKESFDTAIAAEWARHANAGNDASRSGPARGQDTAPVVRDCTFAGFMNECVEGKKVKFVAATLQGPALMWWNVKVATMGLETNNQKEGNARAMATASTKKKVSSGSLPVCERGFTRHDGPCTIKCHKCGKVRHKARHCKEKSVATGANAQPILTCYDCGEQGHTKNRCPKKVKQEEVGEVRGRAYAIKDAEPQGLNVGSDRSFVNTRFSSMLDIDPVKIDTRYEVELADGRVVSTNTVLKGCTLNLVNHIFEIDLMPIELGTFDVIIGMDWLVKHDAVIICGKKVVRIPYENKMLIVESNKGVSRLKVISCIKARNISFEALNVENLVSEEVETGNKASTSGLQDEGQSSTQLVEKINMFEKKLLEGQCVLVDDDGKLVKKRETYVNDDYYPYDDDMYESQDILDNIQSICDNLDIKNLKNPRQDARGILPALVVKKKQVVVSNKDDLGTNEENSKSPRKGPYYGVSLSNHGVFNVACSGASITLIGERIDKVERQIIERKLTLVDDDEKLLPKVVSKKNTDSDSEMQDVVDDHVVLMTSRSTSITPIVERIDKLERQITKLLPKVVSTESLDSDSEVEDVVDDYAVFMASTG